MEELTNAFAPSGFEGPVREIMKRELQAAGAEVKTDGLGSVIGVVRGTSDSPKIMLVAHMDEVGLLVRYITEEGFVKVQTLGGWLNKSLLDKRWTILTHKGPVHAISGQKSVHITSSDEGSTVPKIENIFLDVGVSTREAAQELGIRPGDPIAPWSPFMTLANGRYAGKAWDDRVGCLMLIETARYLKEKGLKTPNTLFFVGSVQEEVGSRGAETASRMVKPDLGLALEVGVAGDHPGVSPDEAQSKLGGGPSLFLYERSMLPNLKLRDYFFQKASEKQIPLQTDVISHYGQDAARIQVHSTGTPTLAFSVPTRYLHTHTSVIDRSDFERGVELLVHALMGLDGETVANMSSFQ
jgi:endoglucanase